MLHTAITELSCQLISEWKGECILRDVNDRSGSVVSHLQTLKLDKGESL